MVEKFPFAPSMVVKCFTLTTALKVNWLCVHNNLHGEYFSSSKFFQIPGCLIGSPHVSFRLFLFQLCLLSGFLSANTTHARALVIGTISDEPVKEIRTYQPFAQYLAQQLTLFGIDEGKVVVARDIDHMADLIRTGQVDLFFDSPLVSLAINQKTGSRPLARRWKNGTAQYHSVIFARENSDIASFQDLSGRIIAFEESFSTSGYLLPRIALAELGIALTMVRPPQLWVSPEQTGCLFTGDNDNTLEWVLRGRVDAGAMSKTQFEKRAATNRAKLKVIMRTIDIPRHLVSAAAQMPQPLLSGLETTLFTLHNSLEGKELLEAFEGTVKFDRIPPETEVLLDQYREPVMALVGVN